MLSPAFSELMFNIYLVTIFQLYCKVCFVKFMEKMMLFEKKQ